MDCFLTRKDPCLQINPTHLNSNSMTCAASFGSNQGLRQFIRPRSWRLVRVSFYRLFIELEIAFLSLFSFINI